LRATYLGSTCRYLGGLISAFQLGGEKQEHEFLIDKAVLLANRLSWGWEGKNRIPFNDVNINDGVEDRTVKEPTCIAGAGTLTMEWGTLSDLTGNKTYRSLAEGAVDAIIDSEPVFPSLLPMQMWPSTGIAKGDYITWGGGSDSFYEYLIKYPFLLGNADHHYLTVYRQAMDSTVKHLLKRTGVGNLTFLADYSTYRANGTVLIHSHLACFSGGNIAMAGRLMKRPDWVEIGLQLTESCAMTYQRSATGVGPVGESIVPLLTKGLLMVDLSQHSDGSMRMAKQRDGSTSVPCDGASTTRM
jgi:mannosyl-oligosaccharide alpha-1,2-mannosidase